MTASSTSTRPVKNLRNIAAIMIDQTGMWGNWSRRSRPPRRNAATINPLTSEFIRNIRKLCLWKKAMGKSFPRTWKTINSRVKPIKQVCRPLNTNMNTVMKEASGPP
ncbi:MAG: hypothetical protein QXF45_05845 [Candidatus Caldarchaeum sp.]|uniref:Uncharacterized protein n=1 Tax=Caldiarchaeum subterraneum TaxID=311458 RepID=A0A7C5Y975_CALS0